MAMTPFLAVFTGQEADEAVANRHYQPAGDDCQADDVEIAVAGGTGHVEVGGAAQGIQDGSLLYRDTGEGAVFLRQGQNTALHGFGSRDMAEGAIPAAVQGLEAMGYLLRDHYPLEPEH